MLITIKGGIGDNNHAALVSKMIRCPFFIGNTISNMQRQNSSASKNSLINVLDIKLSFER